jgi:chorismate-pyruvate lyase
VAETPTSEVELRELIALFYTDPQALGRFDFCASQQCPAAYQVMLDHDAHMTVTVEQRHACAVDVQVLECYANATHYMRKILLRRQSDARVVLFGIVRLALNALQVEVRNEILAQKIPLGRVLILNNVLRQVQLNALWRVVCADELSSLFQVAPGHVSYGRTALIYCDGEPAVELLEIVAPEDTFD